MSIGYKDFYGFNIFEYAGCVTSTTELTITVPSGEWRGGIISTYRGKLVGASFCISCTLTSNAWYVVFEGDDVTSYYISSLGLINKIAQPESDIIIKANYCNYDAREVVLQLMQPLYFNKDMSWALHNIGLGDITVKAKTCAGEIIN